MTKARQSEHPIDARFLARWSPRAYTGETIGEDELLALIEAARWAPSASNHQPWRFVYVRRGTEPWEDAVSLLRPRNQVWARNAAALVFVAARTVVDTDAGPAPSRNYAFDAGAAWAYLALQADHAGWRARAMAGFDADAAHERLNAPEDVRFLVAVAIGRQGPAELLPDDFRDREAPNTRKPLAAIAFANAFASPA